MTTLFNMTDLYDRNIRNDACARNAIGEYAAEFACNLLGMEPLRVDGREKICPDAMWHGEPVEIKSVGKNNRALIYKFRKDKEREHFGSLYRYIFVRHDCRITLRRGRDIRSHFEQFPPTILIATLGCLDKAIGDTPVKVFSMFKGPEEGEAFDRKKHMGYLREGYRDGGWQFSLKLLPIVREEVVKGTPIHYTF